MKAIVYREYGSPDVLELSDIDTPVPADDQVLVRVVAASVNPVDWHTMRGKPYIVRAFGGLRRPKNTGLGADVAGVVDAVGSAVTGFRPGDEVFGMSIRTFAEYVAIKHEGVVHKPRNVSFEEAASAPVAALTALQGLRLGRIRSGQKVLVIGASGGVGTFSVQLAKQFGAEVTAVCSARNTDLVRSIGADHVVDYTAADFSRTGKRYDVVFELAGQRSLRDLRRVLAPRGTLVRCGAPKGQWLGPLVGPLRAKLLSLVSTQTLTSFLARRNQDDLLLLAEYLEAGTLKPVIDRSYPLAETADAMRYLETGHARGKVVIAV